MITPEERVEALELAFYTPMHDRERMAALLNRAADLILVEFQKGIPGDDARLRWFEQQRLSRHLRKYATELLTAERDD